ARRICREAAAECRRPTIAAAVASAKTVAAVERLAKADRQHAATVDQWDIDPWLLNTPAGIIELRTGTIRPARPDDYMTKITNTAPDPRRPIPMWHQFLDHIMAGDLELVAFLQRLAGYMLT